MKQHQKKAHGSAIAERQAQGFRAGADMALAELGPILMRRYFTRGLAIGFALGAFAASLLRWIL